MSEKIVVVGQVARDLVLRVGHAPGAQEAVPAVERIEVLGGKGANQAVALAQLGLPVALLGVVGDDDHVLERARADGIDVAPVVRRAGATTGLIVSLVDDDAHWHYVEHLPAEVLLTEDDVVAARDVLGSASATIVQLQQPAGAALAAVRASGGLVVLDGTPRDDDVLAGADVVRADATEARRLTGARDADEAVDAGRELLARHDLTLVALAVADGDVFVWRDGARVFRHGDERVVDTTGAGDALVATLTAVLVRGGEPAEAAERAVAAAGVAVGHLGGRPHLEGFPLRAG
ncbi:PfkB family carbohydrate kinase [Actinophytocola sp.]|uniref:PfkB family carbohydrate kinase n=1 Tax=Actinophytocola sp. TaxID=1872138 RepID=UPI00389AD79E